jgi:hypothetical protein
MVIFATPANSVNAPTLLNDPVTNGQALIFDASRGVFTNKNITLNLTGAVTSAKNIGGANATGVFKQKTSDGTLEFNNLLAGPGLHITTDNNNNIIFTVDSTMPTISVAENYTIVIDNDANNPNARFEVKTVIPSSAINIDVNVLPPIIVTDLITGNDAGRGFIQSSDIDFEGFGYVSDAIISVEGTGDQDGIYVIDEVITTSSESTIYFIEEFEGPAAINLGGPKNPTEIKQASIWIPDNDGSLGPLYPTDALFSIQVWGANIGPGGYDLKKDMLITITGTEDGIINGTYRVAEVKTSGATPAVKWSGIIFDVATPLPIGLQPGAVFDENPFNNQIKIVSNLFIAPTGFSVDALGVVRATKAIVSAAPVADNDLTNKKYVDDTIDLKISEYEDATVSALNVQIMDLQDRVEKLEKLTSKPLRYYLNHAKF